MKTAKSRDNHVPIFDRLMPPVADTATFGSALRAFTTALALSVPAVALAEAPQSSQKPSVGGKTENPSWESTQGSLLSKNHREQIDSYQWEETMRAQRSNRLARDILADVRRGDFYIPPEPQGFNEREVAAPAHIMEATLRAEFRLLELGQVNEVVLDDTISSLLRRWWQSPRSQRQLFIDERDRRLSPAEVKAASLLYRLACDQSPSRTGSYYRMSGEQFDKAVRKFYEWLGEPSYRPDEESLRGYRDEFKRNLAVLGLEELSQHQLLKEFEDFYDGLRPRQFLASSDSVSRKLTQYQVEEDRGAAADGRQPRNIFLEFERGTFWAPDINPAEIIAGGSFNSDFDLEERNIRPSASEQSRELTHLQNLLESFSISPDLRSQILDLRKKAWDQMPNPPEERLQQLIWRNVGPLELNAIVDYLECRLRYVGKSDEQIFSRLSACRQYYLAKAGPSEPLDDQTRQDIRENFENILIAARKLSQAEIQQKLEQFDSSANK